MFLPEQEQAARSILGTLRAEGAWPVLQHVDAVMARHGVADPAECLMAAPPGLIEIDQPPFDGSQVRLTVTGFYEIERAAPELALFTTAVRGGVSYYMIPPLGSPTQTQRVEADARELVPANGGFTDTQLETVGRLLEVDEIGRVEWIDGPSPWRITIDRSIRRYQGVGSIGDYVRLRRSERGEH